MDDLQFWKDAFDIAKDGAKVLFDFGVSGVVIAACFALIGSAAYGVYKAAMFGADQARQLVAGHLEFLRTMIVTNEKQVENGERMAAASEKSAETQRLQTEVLERMDADCREQHANTHRRLDGHETILGRIAEHLFGDDRHDVHAGGGE